MRVWPGRAVNAGDAVAVVVNVTIVNAQRYGWVQLYPSLVGTPGASSNLNAIRPGQVVANMAVVPVNPNGSLTLYNNAGGHVIIDILGKFVNDGGDAGTQFDPLDQYRVYDTRSCGGCGRLDPNVPRDVKVLDTGDPDDPNAWIPATGVSAVAVTVTADNPAGPQRGFISAVPVGTTSAGTSTANYEFSETVSGTAIVPIVEGSDSIRLLSSLATHVQVDVIGYFGPDAPGGLYHPLTPARFLDTRLPAGSPRPAANALSTVDVAGNLGVPDEAGAIVYNLTVTGSAAIGQAKIAGGSTVPSNTYRSLAIGIANAPVANAGVTQLGAGDVTISANVAAHRILDIAGWFSAGDDPMPVGQLATLQNMDGGVPNGGSFGLDLSADGRYVAFRGGGTDLIEGYVPGEDSDIIRWDRETGELVVVSVAADGGLPDDSIVGFAGMSPDGNLIGFTSWASNLVEDDDDTWPNLYVRNVAAGTTTRYDLGGIGSDNPFNGNHTVTASDDFATFVIGTGAPLVPEDVDTKMDMYVFRPSTSSIELVVDLGPSASDVLRQPSVTADGSAFVVTVGSTVWYWKDGDGASNPSPSFTMLDGDGTTGVALDVQPSTTDISLIDIATGDSTAVCSTGIASTTNPNSLLSPRGLVDVEGDTIVLDAGCGSDVRGVWLIEADGTAVNAFRTWNGAVPNDDYFFAAAVSADGGVVLINTLATNVLPGWETPGAAMYIFDPTP